jgi:4-hydroxy-tetrahydrodipicolinate reductase
MSAAAGPNNDDKPGSNPGHNDSGEEIRVAVSGAAGRMGRTLIQAIHDSSGLRLCAAVDVAGNPFLGSDAGALAGIGDVGVLLSDDLPAALGHADVLIDFTRAAPCIENLRACADAKIRAVVGTTGFDEAQRAQIDELSQHVALLVAPNMSVGVNLTFKLIEMAARALGDSVDIEIIEAHHRHKVDAPSGTAVRMGEIVAQALGRDLASCAVNANAPLLASKPSVRATLLASTR